MTVLVLRPEAKIAETCASFRDANIDCVGIGLIRTQAYKGEIATFIDKLNSEHKPKIAIFISTTAVQMLFSTLSQWPDNIQAIAVGSGTAKLLDDYGVDCIIPNEQTTEGLLVLDELQVISQQSIFLFKGKGGRTLLPETLEKRGAILTIADLYHRIIIENPKATRDWQKHEVRYVLATSGEIIEAAFSCFESEWLKSLTWIVVSRRLVEFAAKLGVENILQSDGAGIEQLIQAIKQVGVMNDG